MSRVANSPVELPKGVEVTLGGSEISIKGSKGTLAMPINAQVEIKQEDNVLTFAARTGDTSARAMSGTTRALVYNMVTGVSTGFEKKTRASWRRLQSAGSGIKDQFDPRIFSPGGL